MDKIALVTGASKGIGREIAIRLAKENIGVIINYNSDTEGAEEVSKICREIGVETLVLKGDIRKENIVIEMFKTIKSKFGKLDILVNNAGITRDNLTMIMKSEDFKEVVDVNLISAFYTMKEASKLMTRNKSGAIVNISSIVGLRGNPGQINYSAAKAGLIGMTKSLARELASRNIRVNAVAPGFIDTNMTRQLAGELKDQLIGEIPMKKLGSPEDVANLVNFLVSEESKYITGQVISVDGGMNI